MNIEICLKDTALPKCKLSSFVAHFEGVFVNKCVTIHTGGHQRLSLVKINVFKTSTYIYISPTLKIEAWYACFGDVDF